MRNMERGGGTGGAEVREGERESGGHTDSQAAVVLVEGDEIEGCISHVCAISVGRYADRNTSVPICDEAYLSSHMGRVP